MNKYEKYCKVRLAINKLQAEKEELEEKILKDMLQIDGQLKTKFGTIYTIKRTTWTYKPEVKKEITEVKNKITEIQTKAQETGLAEKKESNSLGFRTAEVV